MIGNHRFQVSLMYGLGVSLVIASLISFAESDPLISRRYARLIPPGANGNSELSVLSGEGPSKVDAAYGKQLQTLDSQSNFESPNYDFEYKVHGGGNYFGHQESRVDAKAQGRYHVVMPDGRMQVVSYYADETGYHPTITYQLVQNTIGEGGISKGNGYRSKRHFRHSKRVRSKTLRS